MIDEEKLKIFERELSLIQTDTIKRFTEFCILNFPDYFWTLKSSTSNKHHGAEETLIQHIQYCVWLGERVILQFEKIWNQKQNDRLISALLLHDSFRCHNADGEICYFTQEIIDNKGYSQDLLDKFMTSKEHPEAGFRELIKLSLKFNCECVANKKNSIGEKDLTPILNAVRLHYGPWTSDIKEKPYFSLDWPFSNMSIIVHNIDYMATFSAQYFTRIIK